jgi:integrase
MASVARVRSGWRARWRTPQGASRSKTFARKVEAEQHLASVEHSKAAGGYIDSSAGRTTLAQWWGHYENERAKRATTAARDRAVMEKWWLPELGGTALAKITPGAVRGVVDTMRASLASATVRTNYGVLRAVLSAAVDAELVARSPCRAIRLENTRRGEARHISADELHELADAMPVEYRAMVYVGGVLGLRWSEVAGLRVGRVDFLRRSLTVAETLTEVEGHPRFDEPKTRASHRTITVPLAVLDNLSQHLTRRGRPDPDELVFVAPDGGPLRASNFRQRVWSPALRRAGLDGLHFHDLRHSAAALMIEAGAHIETIKRRLGHSSIRVTSDVYGSLLRSVDEEVASDLDGLLGGSSRVTSVSRGRS